MNIIVMMVALAAAAWLELQCPGWDMLGRAKPPVVLAVVVYYALNRSWGWTVAAGLAGGLLRDGLCGLPAGCSPLAFCALGAVVRLYRDIVFSGRHVTHLFFGALTGVALPLMVYGFLAATEPRARELAPAWVALKALGTGLWGLVAAPLAFVALDWLDRTTGNLAEAGTA